MLVLNSDKPRSRHKRWLRAEDKGPVTQPNGGVVAWAQMLGSCLINLTNWGLVNTFGVF